MNKRKFAFYFMAMPAVLLFFVFHTYPALQGIFYSFTNWNGYGDWDFVGFKNYLNVFKDSRAIHAYLFTFKFAIVSTIIVNVFSLLIALGLNSKIKGRNFFRGVYFLPNILSILIVGFIFNYIFAHIIPQLGENLHLETLSKNILGDPDLAWIGIVIVAAWQAIAFNTILYLAGLQTISTDIYEASSIDGAGKWKEFLEYYIPFDRPVLYDQYGAGIEELPDGIRSNRSNDRRWTWYINGIDLLSYL